jgi:hypothetical protein
MAILAHSSSRNLKRGERVRNVAGPSMKMPLFVLGVAFHFELRRLSKAVNANKKNGLSALGKWEWFHELLEGHRHVNNWLFISISGERRTSTARRTRTSVIS